MAIWGSGGIAPPFLSGQLHVPVDKYYVKICTVIVKEIYLHILTDLRFELPPPNTYAVCLHICT
jgi:hypothetical protein